MRMHGSRFQILAGAGEVSSRRVSSGAKMSAGRYDVETATELRDITKRHAAYERMGITDPYVAEALIANSLPLLKRAEWSVKPAIAIKPGEEPTPEASRASVIADLVAANLYGKTGEQFKRKFFQFSPWTVRIREILRMLRHGFSLFQKQWQIVDGKMVYRRLLWLEPSTITQWDISATDEINGIYRSYVRPDGTYTSNEFTPAEELALYVWDLVGTRWEGTPLIRPMYGAFRRREFLHKLKMIAAERSSVGIPYATWIKGEGTSGRTDNTKEAIEAFLDATLGTGIENNRLAASIPSLKIQYLTQDPAGLEVFDSLAGSEAVEASHAGSTKAQMTGEQPNGNRSAAETQDDLRYDVLESISDIIAEQELQGVGNIKGVLQDLVDRNFAEVDDYPTLSFAGVANRRSLERLPFLFQGVSAGVIPKHPEVKRQVCSLLGLELPEEAFEEEPAPLMIPGMLPGQVPPKVEKPGSQDQQQKQQQDKEQNPEKPIEEPEKNPKEKPGVKAEVDPRTCATARRLTLHCNLQDLLRMPSEGQTEGRQRGQGRARTEFEQRFIQVGVIGATLDNGAGQLAATLRTLLRKMGDDLVARGRAGKITTDTFGGLRRSQPKNVEDMYRRVRSSFMNTAIEGRRHVTEELAAQSEAAKKSRRAYAEVNKNDKPENWPWEKKGGLVPPGAGIPKVIERKWAQQVQSVIGELAEEGKLYSEMTVDEMWSYLVNEGIAEYMRLSNKGLEDKELWDQLENYLQDLGTKRTDDAARQTTTVAYNQGRDLAAKEALWNGSAGYAVRSEVLDGNTCQQCKWLDGVTVAIGSPDYEEFMPPNYCEGGERCRGFYVVVSQDLAIAEG